MLEKTPQGGIASGRLGITGATKDLHNVLRHGANIAAAGHGRYVSGLTPVAYAGHDFRAYDTMTVGRACAFYAKVAPTFDTAQLAADLRLADLDERLEIRRLKRAYARALALAIVVAVPHRLVVVEHGEHFDLDAPAALLRSVVQRSENVVVTYADENTVAHECFAKVVDQERFMREYVR